VGGHVGLVALDVHDNIVIRQAQESGRLGKAIAAAEAISACHDGLGAKGGHRVENSLVVGGYDDPLHAVGASDRFHHVLDQRLARPRQERLAWQPRGTEPGWDYRCNAHIADFRFVIVD
jgi:hypothetical protein